MPASDVDVTLTGHDRHKSGKRTSAALAASPTCISCVLKRDCAALQTARNLADLFSSAVFMELNLMTVSCAFEYGTTDRVLSASHLLTSFMLGPLHPQSPGGPPLLIIDVAAW